MPWTSDDFFFVAGVVVLGLILVSLYRWTQS